MALRIFYVVIALIAAFLIYDIYRLYTGYKDLSDVPAEYALGPDDADVTIVEFLDYSCRHCREIHPTIIGAVTKDGNVRYIPRPLPSDDAEAVNAALMAYAAGKQGKFIEMHNELIKNYRVIDEAVVIDLSQKTGIDMVRLGEDIKAHETGEKINENGRMFNKIEGQSTPTFVINDSIIFVPEGRMPTVDDFLKMFNDARAR